MTELNQAMNDVAQTDKTRQSPGLKHWLLQLIPPLLLSGVLLATNSGTSLVFLTGILVLPLLVSLISILVKLIRFRQRKYYLVRPLLVVAIFILIIHIANWSYGTALEQAIDEARIIHDQCNQHSTCPNNPVGWQVDDSIIRKNDLGRWFNYTALYFYDEASFNIRVYQGPDRGDIITGGVNSSFEVAPYRETRN